MIEGRCGACFTHQPGACRRIVEARGGQHFDRDIPIQLLVAGAIHLAHATGNPAC
jgi:hypothetical protein